MSDCVSKFYGVVEGTVANSWLRRIITKAYSHVTASSILISSSLLHLQILNLSTSVLLYIFHLIIDYIYMNNYFWHYSIFLLNRFIGRYSEISKQSGNKNDSELFEATKESLKLEGINLKTLVEIAKVINRIWTCVLKTIVHNSLLDECNYQIYILLRLQNLITGFCNCNSAWIRSIFPNLHFVPNVWSQ